jgi:hypothetical protein
MADTLLKSLKRFPLPLLCSLTATILSIRDIIDFDSWIHNQFILVVALGIPLLLGLQLFAESHSFTKTKQWILQVLGVGLLVGIAYILSLQTYSAFADFYWPLSIAFHLFVAVAAFMGTSSTYAFWQFNRILFQRIALAALYSFLLFGGLSLLMFLISNLGDKLFDYRKAVQIILSVVYGSFNTWFFLNGVPRNLEALKEKGPFPKGLRILTQSVLIPLIGFYLLVLYIYLGLQLSGYEGLKIDFTLWIIPVSVVGIITFLLLHPLQHDPQFPRLKWLMRIYYALLIPLLAFMTWNLSGIDYSVQGISYVVYYYYYVLGIWTLGIAIYLLMSRRQNIKWVPLSLAILFFLSTIGPWSVNAYSFRHDSEKVKTILVENGLWDIVINEDKKIDEVPHEVYADLYWALSTFFYHHGAHGIHKAIPINGVENLYELEGSAEILRVWGLPSHSPYETGKQMKKSSFTVLANQDYIEVKGYDYYKTISLSADQRRDKFFIDGVQLEYYFDNTDLVVLLARDDQHEDTIKCAIGPTVKKIVDEKKTGGSYYSDIPSKQMIIDASGKNWKVRCVLNYVGCKGPNYAPYYVTGYLLIKKP